MTPTELELIKVNLKSQMLYLREGFSLLDGVLKKSEQAANSLTLLRGRGEDIRRARLSSNISAVEEIDQLNWLRYQVIELIESLRPNDINDHIEIKVLVIAPDEPSRKDMEVYFSKLPLKAEVVISGTGFTVESYHLLVFDNRILPDMPNLKDENAIEGDDYILHRNHFQAMKNILADTAKYVVHFGERNFLVSDYREKVYAANSKFALYPRIDEMLKYIRASQESILNPAK